MSLFDSSKNDINNNEYWGGKISIVDNTLFTESASIPLSNISKIYVNDFAKKSSLPNIFWICIAIGIIGFIIEQSTVGVIGIAAAVAIFAYIYYKNQKHDYGLCIESNSGSVEVYKGNTPAELSKVQHEIEKSIIALAKGDEKRPITINMNGNVSYESRDVIVHGGQTGNINTGNYSRL